MAAAQTYSCIRSPRRVHVRENFPPWYEIFDGDRHWVLSIGGNIFVAPLIPFADKGAAVSFRRAVDARFNHRSG